MRAYVIRRLLLMIPTIFLLGTALFFMLRVIPGDVAVGILTTEEASATPEEIEELREYLGLNDHPVEQYFRWVGEVLRGDLGESPLFDATVTSILWSKMAITLELAVLAVLIALIWALPLGIVAALKRGSWLDQADTNSYHGGHIAAQLLGSHHGAPVAGCVFCLESACAVHPVHRGPDRELEDAPDPGSRYRF